MGWNNRFRVRRTEEELTELAEHRSPCSRHSGLSRFLEPERPFDHHDAMPTDLHPLNDIVIRLHLNENP